MNQALYPLEKILFEHFKNRDIAEFIISQDLKRVKIFSDREPSDELYKRFAKEYEDLYNSYIELVMQSYENQVNTVESLLAELKKLNPSALQNLFILICHFLMGDIQTTRRVIQGMITKYPALKQSELFKLMDRISNTRNKNFTRKDYKVLVVVSQFSVPEDDRAIQHLYPIKKMGWDLSTSFRIISSRQFSTIEEFLAFVDGNRPQHLILCGHGNDQEGFMFHLKVGSKRIRREDANSIYSLIYPYGASIVFMLGCNSQLYTTLKTTATSPQYLVVSDSVSMLSTKMYLHGFYRYFTSRYRIETASDVGKVGAAMVGIKINDYETVQVN